ncbi:MAG: hypothetical protein E7572_12570 [Ruminococcaceae bacterium]|jgi:hypothetical protein|nr:hypothetical protein [Oscillospiraceae bacterium]
MTAEQLVMYWIGRIATDAFVSLAAIMLCNYLYDRYRKRQLKRQERIRTKLAIRTMQRQAERSRRKDFIDLMEAGK